MSDPHQDEPDRLLRSVRRHLDRLRGAGEEGKPSLGGQLSQIGALGWMIVVPMVGGLLLGRWLDRLFGWGLTASCALLFLGAALGLWSAFRWMQKP